MQLLIRFDDDEEGMVRAEAMGADLARLSEIPAVEDVEIYDVVRYDPASKREEPDGVSYRMEELVEPSDYRSYLVWAILHRPKEFVRWNEQMEEEGIIVEPGAWVTEQVRILRVALPSQLSALEALVRFNRHSRSVEVISPLLAAHADDLDRAKSDLERAVAWGANDVELTYDVAEAFEEEGHWDEAMPFWERLAHMLPTSAAAREHLAASYAHLGVYHMAATEFDRAADLTDDPTHRARLIAARDLMWERSKV
ncbi:MAG: hypothetical protein M3220_20220 [Chloroflexota bacterium]|nr:hypothetical protein [Chloroflexota bacterium]